jgi:hypothetical protein
VYAHIEVITVPHWEVWNRTKIGVSVLHSKDYSFSLLRERLRSSTNEARKCSKRILISGLGWLLAGLATASYY